MSRLLSLYPRWWRERYGDEFAALLEEVPSTPRVVVDVVLNALRTQLDLSGMENEMQDLFGRADERRDARLAVVALALVVPTWVYIVLSVLKYGLGVDQPFDAAAPLFLNQPVEVFTILAPAVAVLVSVVPIVRIRIGLDAGHVNGLLAVRARPLNLLVALLTIGVVALLVAYFFLENILGRGA